MRRARRLALLAVFAAVSLSTRAAFLRVPFLDLDEAAHLVGSWTLMAGGRLYTDFVDNKPPLLYAYYAFAQLVCGRGLFAVRLFSAALTLPLTAYALSAYYRHDRRGALAGLIYLVYGASFLAHDMHAANAELVMLLPAAAAVAALANAAARPRRTALVAGVLLGLAALVKPQALLWLPALGVGLLAPGTAVGAPFALLACGFALPLAAAWAAFAATGGASDFVYWTLGWNFAYSDNPIPASEAVLRAARGLLPFLAVTAPLWLAAWHGLRALPMRPRFTLAALLVTTLPAVFVGLRFFPHYFIQLYVPLALAASPALAPLLTPPLRMPGRLFLAWTGLAFGGFTAANLWLYSPAAHVYPETRPIFEDVARKLGADPCRQDASLFVWGYAPMFYVTTGLRPASRFVVPQASLTGYLPGNTASARGELDLSALIDPRHRALLLEDLERSRATYVLDATHAGLYHWERHPLASFPALDDYVRRHYEPAFELEGVRVLRRLACGPAERAP